MISHRTKVTKDFILCYSNTNLQLSKHLYSYEPNTLDSINKKDKSKHSTIQLLS